jgi:hypothetical protein
MPRISSLCICVKNQGYEASLELRKIYEVISDAEAEGIGQMRVIDESGEDYLYPEDFFVRVKLPAAVEQRLMGSV